MAATSPLSAAQRSEQAALASAIAAHRDGRLRDAEREYREVLDGNPRQDDALHGLGLLAQQIGDLVSAERWMRAAIAEEPRAAVYRSNLGNVLQQRGLLEEAVAEYRIALHLRPDSAAAWSNLGAALLALGRAEEAVGALERAAALRPDLAQVADNLGNALQAAGRLEEALALHQRALRLRPDHAETLCNLGLVQAGLGGWDAAMASFERALALEPGNARVQLARAQLQLLLGDFERGLPNYEWRKRVHGERRFAGRVWRGQPLAPGECLLLYAEQGLGDTIQFLRYGAAARERMGEDGELLVEVQPAMLRLAEEVRDSLPWRVVAAGQPLPRYDWHCSLMSLPLVLGLGEYPGTAAYLRVPEAARRKAERVFSQLPVASRTRLRVGLVWAGSAAHVRDRFRSIPFALLRPLLAMEGVDFFSFQIGGAAAAAGMRLEDWSGPIEDLADTAALLEGMDLTIGVDTAVVHLAGALGKRVWTMLPFWPDWRWGLGREDSPWYSTMRLFRQSKPGDWAGVVEAVCGELARTSKAGGE